MDDSQAKNDNLAERLQNRAQELAQRKREEYEKLFRLLEERVEERNANSGNLPKYVLSASRIELGPYALYFEFDPLFSNPTDYVLVLKVGLAPFKKPLDGRGPTPEKYELQPKPTDDLSRIVWESGLEKMTSAYLVEFALEQLTAYYLKHKRK